MASRVRDTDTAVLSGYVDHVGGALFQAYDDLRKEHKAESADEIEQALMTLWAVTRELRARYDL